MTIRNLKPSDIPILREMAERSGFPYPDLSQSHIEEIRVVADSEDRPIIACAAKRLVEMYLFVDSESTPAVKMDALKLMHREMAAALKEKGYDSVECFLPPQIEKTFGKRLQRSFGWVRNWASFCLKF